MKQEIIEKLLSSLHVPVYLQKIVSLSLSILFMTIKGFKIDPVIIHLSILYIEDQQKGSYCINGSWQYHFFINKGAIGKSRFLTKYLELYRIPSLFQGLNFPSLLSLFITFIRSILNIWIKWYQNLNSSRILT